VIEHHQGEVCYLQFDLYQQFPEIIHGVFTRHGGHSPPPYESLNVSWSGGDVLDNILPNRLLALRTLEIESYPCATLWQTHGADVAVFERDNWDDWRHDWGHRSYEVEGQELIWTFKPRRKADAIITRERGVTLALSFADCVPLVFYDPLQKVLGMAHAGWRSTARGIVAATVEAMSEQFGCKPHDIYVGIGPSIGPCCYEVSEQVQQLFQGRADVPFIAPATWGGATDWEPTRYTSLVRESAVFSTVPVGADLSPPTPPTADLSASACPTILSTSIIAPNKGDDSALDTMNRAPTLRTSLHLDLWQTNRNQLLMAGVLPEHIEAPGICTSCHRDRFFSHRGEHGKTGRFPVIMALRTSGFAHA